MLLLSENIRGLSYRNNSDVNREKWISTDVRAKQSHFQERMKSIWS